MFSIQRQCQRLLLNLRLVLKSVEPFSVHIVHVWLDKEKPVPIHFAAEAYTSLIKDTACTSCPCEWLSPNVNYALICNIDFSVPIMRGRERLMKKNRE